MTNSLIDFTLSDLLRAQELFDLAQKALDETGANGTAIALRQGNTYVCFAVAGETAPTLGVALTTDQGITGACIHSGQTEICHDAATDDRVNAEACESLQIASVIAVPVLDGDEVIGVVEALAREPYAFGAEEQAMLEALAMQLQPAPTPTIENRLDPPIMIDRPSPPKEVEASTETAVKTDAAATLPPPETETPAEDKPLLTPALYSQQHGSWTRGIVIAVVFVCVVVGLVVSLAHVSAKNSSPAAAAPRSTAPSALPAIPDVAPAPPIPPRPGSPESIAELQIAAMAGNAPSQLKLATALAHGKGVRKDLVSAYAWYIIASMAGEDDSSKFLPSLAKRLSATQTAEVRVKLAEMFWKGSGVKQDSTAAYTWLLLAEAAGSPTASTYEQRLAAEMNASDIRDAERRADVWLKQHRQPTLHR